MRRVAATVLTVTAVGLGVAALILLGRTSQDSEQFGRLNDWLLLVNAAGAMILLALIAANLLRLLRDHRRRVPGTRLKARMLRAFLVLAVAPLAIVYVFAVQFVNQGIENWFDVEIETGLGDALEMSRSALDVRMRGQLDRTRSIARELARLRPDEMVLTLGELRADAGAAELTVFGGGYRIIATSAGDPGAGFPVQPPDDALLQVDRAGAYVGLDPTTADSYQIRALVLLPNLEPGSESLTLQAIYPVGGRLGSLADSVERSYTRYGELAYLRDPLKYSFTLTLTVVLLLSFLAALYGAFFFARRLVAPIQSLAAGTRAVARGDLETRLPMASHDELGFLIDSFNAMIERLAEARESARISAQAVERERARLEATLARLSTGVIAMDADGTIQVANDAASSILGVTLAGRSGERLADVAPGHVLLEQLVAALHAHLESGEPEWREQLTLRGETGRKVLVCACTALPLEGSTVGGRVLVFDDVTALLQAQRDAAWGEVARRLAHEIKNPLTPIQLSAERIRRRYLKDMKDMEAEVLDRATHTIVQQVEAMRDMVNAFSEYARAPELNLSLVDLNALVREVAYLYQARGDSQSALRLTLDGDLQPIRIDAVRMRQLLHNLIRNAMEATEGQPGAVLSVETCVTSGGDMAELRVRDNGPGIDPETLDRIFEPYVTTKTKGTGLGLAIVKKLVEEHGGTVTAENLPGGGACITVRLPVEQTTRDGAPGGRAGPEMRRESA